MSVGGDELLIRGDDALSREESPPRVIVGHAAAADGLDHYRDLGIVLNEGEVLRHQSGKGTVGEIPDIHDILYRYLLGRVMRDRLVIFAYDLADAASHGPEAEHGNFCHRITPFPK